MTPSRLTLTLTLLLTLASPLPATELQLLVFQRPAEATPFEILPIPIPDLPAQVQNLQPPLSAQHLRLNPQPSQTLLRWQIDNVHYTLKLDTQLLEALTFTIALNTAVQADLFGASLPNTSRSAKGEIPFPLDQAYLLDAGNILVLLAPARTLPTTADSEQITRTP
ncbi:MAG: hypothetical protein SNJ84_06585 [Verrucomicrobiia bacterium]